jgi:hypothetical protein
VGYHPEVEAYEHCVRSRPECQQDASKVPIEYLEDALHTILEVTRDYSSLSKSDSGSNGSS